MKDAKINIMMSYLKMTKAQEAKFMAECINGKQHYSDRTLAFGLSLNLSKQYEQIK